MVSRVESVISAWGVMPASDRVARGEVPINVQQLD